jgi:hypothetical protein
VRLVHCSDPFSRAYDHQIYLPCPHTPAKELTYFRFVDTDIPVDEAEHLCTRASLIADANALEAATSTQATLISPRKLQQWFDDIPMDHRKRLEYIVETDPKILNLHVNRTNIRVPNAFPGICQAAPTTELKKLLIGEPPDLKTFVQKNNAFVGQEFTNVDIFQAATEAYRNFTAYLYPEVAKRLVTYDRQFASFRSAFGNQQIQFKEFVALDKENRKSFEWSNLDSIQLNPILATRFNNKHILGHSSSDSNKRQRTYQGSENRPKPICINFNHRSCSIPNCNFDHKCPSCRQTSPFKDHQQCNPDNATGDALRRLIVLAMQNR